MATRKESGGYVVIRDCAAGTAGQTVSLDDDIAALLIRDGMVRPQTEGR